MSPLLFLIGAGALFALLSRPRFDPYAPLGTVTLHQGVPYRIAIRTTIRSVEAAESVQDSLRSRILATAGASAPTFLAIDSPPVWLPAGAAGWGRLLTVFDVTPVKTQETAVGRAIEGLGNVEWILRLDGKSFGDIA